MRRVWTFAAVVIATTACAPTCALHANAIYADDAADAVNAQLTTFLFDPNPDAAAKAVAPSAPPDWLAQEADLRRTIDQSCGVITEATPVESAMGKSGPSMLDLLYVVTSSRGPCYLRVVVATPSQGTYVLKGIYVRMERYTGMEPINGAARVTCPPGAVRAPETRVEVDRPALDASNAFVRNLIVEPDPRSASRELTQAARAAFPGDSLGTWSTQATTALGHVQTVRPARFLQLSHRTDVVYEVVGSQKSGSMIVALVTTAGSSMIAGFQAASGGASLQPGMDLPKELQTDLVAR